MIARLLVCLLAVAGRAQGAGCTVEMRATVGLEVAGGAIMIPVEVNGISGTFILDTGAARTVVTPAAVARFGLARDEWTATTLHGVGGVERNRDANPRLITLGGIALHRRSLSMDATLRVAAMPRSIVAGHRIDGLLGRDFLSVFDIDLDSSGRVISLYNVRDCAGRFIPWTDRYVSLPVENMADNALIVSVVLDGTRLRGLLDTGANQTLIAAPGMARLGLSLDRLGGDPAQIVSGLGLHTVTVWRHRFGTIQIGGDIISSPSFLVAPVQLRPISDLLLGADWLLGRRLWISWSTRQIFAIR